MDLFSEFCNICYKTNDGSLSNITEENTKHIKDILITFLGHADIKYNMIYLCKLCCEELIRFDKFREMCMNNLIQLRQRVFDMKCKFEFEDHTSTVRNTLQTFINEEVLRKNSLESCNSPVSISTENLYINDSIFNRQLINLKLEKNECELDDNGNGDVSVINNAAECDEHRVASPPTEEDMKNEEIRCSDNTTNMVEFERKVHEDFTTSDINNANVKNTSQIEFIKVEVDLNNKIGSSDSEHFENEYTSLDVREPVLNNSEESFNSGTDFTKQEFRVKQENSTLQDFELETIEDDFADRLKVAFEITNVSIGNMEDRGGCNNELTPAISNAEPSRPRVWQHGNGRYPTALASGAEQHTCDVCNKSFGSSTCLARHQCTHKGDRQHKCTLCKKTFSHSSGLSRHKRTHTGDRPHKCTVCNKSFTQSCHLDTHKRIHSGERPYQCSVCNKTFRDAYSWTIHKRIHTGIRPCECTVCNKTFRDSSSLSKHKRIHSSHRPYECGVCNKAFRQSMHLSAHERTHSGDRQFQCFVCQKTFTTSSGLTIHERNHSGDRPYECSVCNKKFPYSSSLIKHKRIHSGDRPFNCTVCNKEFRQSAHLITHERIHSGDTPYKCPVCAKTFTDASNFTKHEQAHIDSRPYKCTVCQQTFITSSALTLHERIHSGDRPYKCSICNNTFTHSSSLTKHKRIHSGDKPYKCSVCNKDFRQSAHLNTHKRLHSGDTVQMPYLC